MIKRIINYFYCSPSAEFIEALNLLDPMRDIYLIIYLKSMSQRRANRISSSLLPGLRVHGRIKKSI